MPERPDELLEHLFRRESGRITAALTRLFGVHNLPLVEDVTSEALCRALEVWKYRGLPDNPSAWLMSTARNRAIDLLRRERTARSFAPDLKDLLSTEWALLPAVDELFGEQSLRDEQLRMMFACCHARLSEETQVALILNLLCGFSVAEVAAAFLASEPTLQKRIVRGKKVLAASGRLPDVTRERAAEFLGAVHAALYLLFNEGYHGANAAQTVRAELCGEGIRLAELLSEAPSTSTPETHALLAVMCLSAARLPGRTGPDGELVAWSAQDRSRWDARLVERGVKALEASACGDQVTALHLEAAIAYEHTTAPTLDQTNFARIVSLYDLLLKLRPSPVVAMSRAIAIGEVQGPERALEELAGVKGRVRLERYPFFVAAVGEQQLRAGKRAAARESFRSAVRLARSPTEARFFEARAEACTSET
jgi:RNA polymerase sigma factor (sigma-70 family)